MGSLKGSLQPKLCGQKAIPHSLELVIQQTLRLWRKHHLDYDQTKYVVERVRRRLGLEPSRTRKRTVSRLDHREVERLVGPPVVKAECGAVAAAGVWGSEGRVGAGLPVLSIGRDCLGGSTGGRGAWGGVMGADAEADQLRSAR